MAAKNIEQRVVALIAEYFRMDEGSIRNTHKSAWGLDSLDEIEIVMALEDEFGIVIRDEDAEKWQTVADVVAYVSAVTA